IKSKDLLREQETQNILIEKFGKSADEAKNVMNKLLILVDEDAKAYENVLRKLKKLRKVKIGDSKREIDISKTKKDIQEAYENAAEVPLQTARLCYKVLRNSQNLTDKINNAIKSDFQIAISLLELAIRGAALNVEVNLKEIVDRKYVIEKKNELNRIIQIL
ncbi:unnamed protein product, partial [marine sediment metagenome]